MSSRYAMREKVKNPSSENDKRDHKSKQGKVKQSKRHFKGSSMYVVHIRHERKGEKSVIWKWQKRPQKPVRKSKTKEISQNTFSNTFAFFKDFARSAKSKARLANWMKCSWDIFSMIYNFYSSSSYRSLIDEKNSLKILHFFQVSWW